jgi:cell division protein FtsI (penicillin-binding protein 3)
MKKFAKKVNLLFFIISLAFLIFILINLIKITLNKTNLDQKYTKTEITRGEILDRNGEVLATSIKTKDLYINFKHILDKEKLFKKLTMMFPNKVHLLKLNKQKKYILLKKHLSLDEINELKKIGDPGIVLQTSEKRIYPQHNIFSHLTGFKIDKLKSKLENNFDSTLSIGNDLRLTVDLKVQNIVRDELIKGLELYNAKSALSIVMNVKNGEILSMVSLPDFDPNFPRTIQAFTENNLVTEARYEMGSTLKMFNAALAFELKSSVIKKKFDISKGYQLTNKSTINDTHIRLDTINFDQAFIHSSNIASIKIIEQIGIEKQKILFKNIGLTENPHVNGLNIVSNKGPRIWNDTYSKSMSYGYGISLSPISLVSSFSTLVNGGLSVTPVIIKQDLNNKKKRVLSKKTSKMINLLLEKVVKNGTGRTANVTGLKLGGKTGTSKKVENGEYSEKKVITSFIGVFPIDNPNFLTFVLFDEPQRNTGLSLESFGSNTAAPTFSKIVSKISPILIQNNYFKYSRNENK